MINKTYFKRKRIINSAKYGIVKLFVKVTCNKLLLFGTFGTSKLCSFANNEGRQETITGYGTTHHTNSIVFQPKKGDSQGNTVIDQAFVIESTHLGALGILPNLITKRKLSASLLNKNLTNQKCNT